MNRKLKKFFFRLLSLATVSILFWYWILTPDDGVAIKQEPIIMLSKNLSQSVLIPNTTSSQTQTQTTTAAATTTTTATITSSSTTSSTSITTTTTTTTKTTTTTTTTKTTTTTTTTTSTSSSTTSSAISTASTTSPNEPTLATVSNTAPATSYRRFITACSSLHSGPKFKANFTGECSARLTEAIPAVSCEMLKSFSFSMSSNSSSADLESSAVQHDCQPRNFTYSCDSLNQSSLNCTQPHIVVAGFDYVKQHHCLSRIADQVAVQMELENNSTGNGNPKAKVPRIIQYVWYYGSSKNFDIAFYLGMISTLRYFRPKVIFLWHDGVLPQGRWWQELLKQLHPPQADIAKGRSNVSIPWRNTTRIVHFFEQTKLYFVYRQRPTHIYGNLMTHDAHKSDVVRMEALIHYGGLYIDTDVLAIRNLDTFVQYSVTMPKEPNNAISNSIIFAERDAPYLYLWHHTYTSFRSSEWGEHSTLGNYQVYRACPSYLQIEPDKLLKPSNNKKLYVEDVVLTTKYLFHLYLNWEPKYAPKGSFREAKEPEEILDWYCTMGRVMRSIFFGTCDEFCG